MEVHQILKIRLKPGLRNPELSEEQKALLEIYKQNGLDLSQWIGVIPVKVKINSPADGFYEPFITGIYERIHRKNRYYPKRTVHRKRSRN